MQDRGFLKRKTFTDIDLVLLLRKSIIYKSISERELLEDNEQNILIDEEIRSSPATVADRFRQGARRYGAVWDGRVIDTFWTVANMAFYDKHEGFTLKMGPQECYMFDYKGINKKRFFY